MNSKIFRFVTQANSHLFVHEMGHAIVYKILTNQTPTISVFTNVCMAVTQFSNTSLSDSEAFAVSLAGPMADIAFSSAQLVAAVAFRNSISLPVACVLGAGSVAWMCGELFYASVSASKRDDGDFGKIAQQGNLPLALATAAILAECALGIFAASRFL